MPGVKPSKKLAYLFFYDNRFSRLRLGEAFGDEDQFF